MGLYNMTGISNFGGMIDSANSATNGWLGLGILVFIFLIILIMIIKNEQGFGVALAGSGTLAFIIASILFVANWVSSYAVFIFLVIAVLGYILILKE